MDFFKLHNSKIVKTYFQINTDEEIMSFRISVTRTTVVGLNGYDVSPLLKKKNLMSWKFLVLIE